MAMNFRRAVVDAKRPNIAIDALNHGIAGDADRSEYLQTAINDAAERLRTEDLAHAGFIARVRMLVQQPGGVPDCEPREMQIDGIIGEHESDAPMFADRAAE